MYQHLCKKCGNIYKNYRKDSDFCSVNCRASFQHDKFLLKSKELIDERFGKLVVIDTKIENNKVKCLCICDCGNKIWINSCNLKNKHTLSCRLLSKRTSSKK